MPSGQPQKRTFVLRERRHLENLLVFVAGNWEAMACTKHPMQVDIHPEATKRSLRQNRRYWAVLNQISEQAWIEGRQYSSECWHEAAKRKFIGCIDLPGGGMVAMSTTDLTTKDFAEYCAQVEAWAQTELGCELTEDIEPMGRMV